MRAVVIGASGQVGRALQAALTSIRREYIATSSRPEGEYQLNLSDPHSIEVFFRRYAKDFPGEKSEVYLSGAMTHVDRCETERDRCRKINVDGPIRVGELCAEYGHRLCFYSSEYVYGQAEYEGGAIGPFREGDSPDPTSYYGACKLEAEEGLLAIRNLHPLILRTTMVFSYDPQGMNFFMQLYRQLWSLEHGEEVPVFRIPLDQISTPTYAPALVSASLDLLARKVEGIYHLVGKDLLSRPEFLNRVVANFGFTPEKIKKGFAFVRTADLGQTARRPLTAGLRVEKAIKTGVKVWNLEEAFADLKTRMPKD